MTPYILGEKVNLKPDARDILTGIAVSVVILLPFWFLAPQTGKPLPFPRMSMALFQIFGVAFPEEIYFRGFLQERLGNTVRGVLIVSVLFSITHVPQLIFYDDPYALMTFFPSLVMGFLYLRTSNVIPSTFFHAAANIVFLGLL